LFSSGVDALAFKGITAERMGTMDFSPPLTVSGAGLFRPPGLREHDDPRCGPAMRVATSEHGPFVSKLRKDFPELQVVATESSDAAFQMLLDGRVELAAMNMHAGPVLASELPSVRIGLLKAHYAPLEVSFAVAKGRARELLESCSAPRSRASMRRAARAYRAPLAGTGPGYRRRRGSGPATHVSSGEVRRCQLVGLRGRPPRTIN
jgi:hypothetical protein